MTQAAPVDIAFLERRRRLACRSAAVALLVAVICLPLGMAIGGTDTADTIGGMFLFAGIVGIVAAPWIVRAWRGFMQRRMVEAAVSGRPDIRHIDSERDRRGVEAALDSPAFALGAFRGSGLVEAFESSAVEHVLTGEAQGVPFAVAELALLDAKGFAVFGGVLASFRLARPRPGLTIVARDRGLLGNLVARAGSDIGRLPLEDPDFEGVFEVYGDDQVGGRVILTTTMLERLKALDDMGHARGFACAFRGEHLLVAFSGMNWRCPVSRIVQPVDTWLHTYTRWLGSLIDLPRDMVKTLNLIAAPVDSGTPLVAQAVSTVPIHAGPAGVFSSGLSRLVGEGGMSLVYTMSGALIGGVALIGATYGLTRGYSTNLFWPMWVLIVPGLIYGVGAFSAGVWQLARLAWKWNSPLRTMKRP